MEKSKRTLTQVTLEYPPDIGGIGVYVKSVEEAIEGSRVVKFNGIIPWWRALLSMWKERNGVIFLVHAVFPLGTAVLILYLLTGTPYMVMFHGMDYDIARSVWWRRILLWVILKFSKCIVVNTNSLRREVEKEYPSKRVFAVRPTVDSLFLKLLPELKERSTKPTQKGDHVLRLLTVGRLVKRKNHEEVIRAIVHVPGVVYDIVGDGPERAHLEALAREVGVAERVVFHGSLDSQELMKCYRDADIFIAISTRNSRDREGFGIVYLEAQCCGLPVIAYRQDGVVEALDDKAVIYSQPFTLIRDISLLVTDADLRERMGEAGRRFAIEFTKRERLHNELKEMMSL